MGFLRKLGRKIVSLFGKIVDTLNKVWDAWLAPFKLLQEHLNEILAVIFVVCCVMIFIPPLTILALVYFLIAVAIAVFAPGAVTEAIRAIANLIKHIITDVVIPVVLAAVSAVTDAVGSSISSMFSGLPWVKIGAAGLIGYGTYKYVKKDDQ